MKWLISKKADMATKTRILECCLASVRKEIADYTGKVDLSGILNISLRMEVPIISLRMFHVGVLSFDILCAPKTSSKLHNIS